MCEKIPDYYHQEYCCVIHGCSYGDDACPVINKKIKQNMCHICEAYDQFYSEENLNSFWKECGLQLDSGRTSTEGLF